MTLNLQKLETDVSSIRKTLTYKLKKTELGKLPDNLNNKTFATWYNKTNLEPQATLNTTPEGMQNEGFAPWKKKKSSKKKITLKELLHLLEDGYKGNFNKLVQEAIKSAKSQLSITPIDPNNPEGRQQLEINIKVASTLIDRYAGVLTMAIGKKKQAKKEDKKSEKIITKAKKFLDESAKEIQSLELQYKKHLQVLELKLALKSLPEFCEKYKSEHKTSTCFPNFFSCFFKPNHTLYNDILTWLSKALPIQDGLTLAELTGGILTIQSKLGKVKDKDDRETLQVGINNILSAHYYTYVNEKEATQVTAHYIELFEKRLPDINFRLPASLGDDTNINQLTPLFDNKPTALKG